MTQYKNFGGQPREYTTHNNTNSMPFQHKYNFCGNGRDTYIGNDNGGNFKMYHPDLHPNRGSFGFGER